MTWILGSLAALLLVLLAAGPPLVEHLVRSRVLPRLQSRLGCPISVSAVHAGWNWIQFEHFTLDPELPLPPLEAPSVVAYFRWLSLLDGRVEIAEVVLENPRLNLVRGGDGDNVSALVDRLGRTSSQSSASPVADASSIKIEKVRLTSASVDATSAAPHAEAALHVSKLDAEIRPHGRGGAKLQDAWVQLAGGPRASAESLQVGFALDGRSLIGLPDVSVHGAAISPFRSLTLSGISGSFHPTEDKKSLKVELRGSYGDDAAPLWGANGVVTLQPLSGELHLSAERFALSQLEALLARHQAVLQTKRASVNARLDLKLEEEVLDVSGAMHLSGLGVAHAMLGPLPLGSLGFDARLAARVDLARKRLELTEAAIDFRNLHARLIATVDHLGFKPRVSATFDVAPVDCQTALDALPVELVPVLQGFRLAGSFSSHLHLAVDFSDLEQPIDLDGQVGIEGCRVFQASEWASVARLQAPFEQTVETEPGKWMTFLAGPDNPNWAAYADISPHIVNSIMTTEDSGFFKHRGFISSEFRSALQQNLQRGYFRLGASSITMQLVKNTILSREKTLSRKLQEMFLTWYLEHNLSKERIMELYLNVIEFGPSIYGIGRATRHYFGKTPAELAPKEAAWFSSILPSPKRRYAHFCPASGVLDAKWDSYLNRILRRMHERGRLTDPEYETAIATPLQFSRAEAPPEAQCFALVKRLTTPLPEPVAIDQN